MPAGRQQDRAKKTRVQQEAEALLVLVLGGERGAPAPEDVPGPVGELLREMLEIVWRGMVAEAVEAYSHQPELLPQLLTLAANAVTRNGEAQATRLLHRVVSPYVKKMTALHGTEDPADWPTKWENVPDR